MTLLQRRRVCSSCGRRWSRDATYCGACGAPLADEPTTTETTATRGRRSSWRRWGVAAAVAAAVVAAVVVLPGIGPRGLVGDGVGDDTIELPTDVPTARRSPSGPVPVQCTQDRVVVDCLAWDVDTGERVSLGPRLPDGRVLVDDRPDGLTVRDAGTGEVRWRRDDLGAAGAIQVVGDVLLVRDDRDVVQALDLVDGSDRWRVTGARSLGPVPGLTPAFAILGRVSEDGDGVDGLLAVDPATGKPGWEWATPWDGPIATAVQPIAPDGLLVTGDGQLARVEVATGRTGWTVDTLDGGYLQVHPPDDVTVQQLTEGQDPELWVHDARTGEVVLRLPAGRIANHVVVGERLVAHAPAEGVVRAHDLTTGERVWTVVLDSGPGALGFPGAVPGAVRDAVVVLERGQRQVSRLDPATGEPLWTASLQPAPRPTAGGTFLGTPAIVDDVVVIEDTSSAVTVLDLATGVERVRVAGAPDLDVRSLDPLTLVQDARWMAVDVPPAQ